jgi:hypothetical protein
MSDVELHKFGQAAQRMMPPKANPGQPPPEVFVIQLGEARIEWNRRESHPKRQNRTNINDFTVGDRVKVNIHRDRIVDATIKAIIDRADDKRPPVDLAKGVDSFVAGRSAQIVPESGAVLI